MTSVPTRAPAQPLPLATTPVIAGFHPDPTVCRVDQRYYLVNSSFEYAPGLPIFTSTDLVAWEQVGNIAVRRSQLPAGERGPSRGFFAPTLRHHDGQFWLVVTDVETPDPTHQLIFRAEDPAGPWSDPVQVPLAGIDPDLTWDDEGRCYLTWAAPGFGSSHIQQVRIEPATGAVLSTPRSLWSGTGGAYPEGPHLYRRGDWWYLLLSEGGTERAHSVVVARSRSIEGPFQGCPDNPVLTHRGILHPVQNTGHPDLVELPGGSWAMVYLGVRPRGLTPSFHVNGRETFLAGVDWVQDWPVIDVDRYHGTPTPTSFRDTFEGPELHPRWVSPGAFPDEFTSLQPAGGVLVHSAAALNGSPSALCVRTRDPYWRTEVELDLSGASCEVLVRLDDDHLAVLHLDGERAFAELRIGPVTASVGGQLDSPGDAVTAVVSSVPASGFGPDDLELAVRVGDTSHVLARLDGRYLSTEVAAGFTGRVVGVAAGSGPVRLTRFAYTAGDEERR